VDTWIWGEEASEGYHEIITGYQGRFPQQTIELLKGLRAVLGQGDLLAYIVSMTLRIAEIFRVLKPTGTFFLHCDPTASHYLKLVLDSIFVPQGGDYLNELVWCYSQGGRSKSWFPRKHDTIFWFAKGKNWTFNDKDIRIPYELLSEKSQTSFTKTDEKGRKYKEIYGPGKHKLYRYYEDEGKVPYDWWTDIHQMTGRTAASGNEYLGYQTQKPEALLERLIKAASNVGDTVLDSYCGCGTTIQVAQKLGRRWIGIDITYQSISLILKRLEDSAHADKRKEVMQSIVLDGIPQDMESAIALANKADDKVRKEFEKWALLTYSNNRAAINEKKGGDKGVDGVAYFLVDKEESAKVIFQVKSGGAKRETVAALRGDMAREDAKIGILIVLEEPTKGMREEAANAGKYHHQIIDRKDDCIQIVTVKEIVEDGKRLQLPWGGLAMVKSAIAEASKQASLL
jgi:site-specific DNA-methyltransferase (adenine-specific)